MPIPSLAIVYTDPAGSPHRRRIVDGVVAGRDPDCGIVIASELVSRFHCRFQLEGEQWVVEDTGSRNGIQLNGKQIERGVVTVGDRVQVGSAELVVVAAADNDVAMSMELDRETIRERIHEGNEKFSLDPRRWAETVSPGRPQREVPIVARFEALFRCSLLAASARSTDELLTGALSVLAPLFSAVHCGAFTAHDTKLRLVNELGDASSSDPRPAAEAAFGDGASMIVSVDPQSYLMVATLHTLTSRLGVMTVRCPPGARPAREDLELLIACANQVALAIEAVRLREGLRAENALLRQKLGAGDHSLIGSSPAMRRVGELISRAAEVDSCVLIRGESGTGKELVAAAIHRSSSRAEGPFVAINCGALSPTLLTSELFGHEKGAFTGADRRKAGVFEQATGGTLFLDELAELPADAQAHLLRALESYRIKRVGGLEEVPVDVRIVAATHRDLEALVDSGEFREDLFYRVQVLVLDLPPLRDRLSDIPELCAHLLGDLQQKIGRKIGDVSPEAVDKLTAYHWPGNVRELRNVLERAAILGRGGDIGVDDITGYRRSGESTSSPNQTLRDAEAAHIAAVLSTVGWNKTKAAEILGIQRSTIYQKIKEHGLEQPDA